EFICRSWERMAGTGAHEKFRSGFQSIINDPAAGGHVIAGKLLDGFLPLVNSGKLDDDGCFTMGAPEKEEPDWDSSGGKQDNPLHQVILTPYQMHRFCVSNLEYELFDPRHKDHRW